ncbi:molybdenum cofactor biosynthesis protein MoaE [Shimia marina]|uniref:Molybdopterin synthase catalytic subunit n=1 Tax=Shimia marina TaxID=321267 RepID=A0A0P1EQA4_9RHOB|nr:molybdenum cofactor biosynthesis protein MoaE [Shimia marina]CUH52584.1 Molybdopterin synthase catalytic subunit [Shimia marina]SFE50721.1 molybdopterin synthase subunit MoaE [Shimia marina]
MRVLVQEEAFDFGREAQAFASGHSNMGAIVTFTGVVRDSDKGGMERMVIEHYPGMTQKALETIAKDAVSRWDLGDVLVIHRHGELRPGEMIMMVATAARHRVNAFEAAEFLMDYLKSRAPFWKKEYGADGAEWVAAKDEDEDALSRW